MDHQRFCEAQMRINLRFKEVESLKKVHGRSGKSSEVQKRINVVGCNACRLLNGLYARPLTLESKMYKKKSWFSERNKKGLNKERDS